MANIQAGIKNIFQKTIYHQNTRIRARGIRYADNPIIPIMTPEKPSVGIDSDPPIKNDIESLMPTTKVTNSMTMMYCNLLPTNNSKAGAKAKKKIMDALAELEITKDEIDNVGYTKRLWDMGIRDKKYFMK